MMRKFFLGLGVVMAGLIVAAAVGFFVLARNGAALDAESKAYIDDAVVSIGSHWDANELWKRSTAHFRQVTKEDDLRALFDAAKDALGPMREYRGARGDASISVTNAGTTISAKYLAKVTYEKGDADVQIVVVKRDSTWLIEGFHIGSPQLMRRLVGLRS